MPSLEFLHTAHIASLNGSRKEILDYYARNADILLQYYEGQGDDEYALHEWRMRNDSTYTADLTLRSKGRCTTCGSKVLADAEACSHAVL